MDDVAAGAMSSGDARTDFTVAHAFGTGDFEVREMHPNQRDVDALIVTWKSRARPSRWHG